MTPSPFAVDLTDPAVAARLIVLASLHDDQDAADHLARRRPDLDLDTMKLVAEIAAAVAIDLRHPVANAKVLYVRKPQ